MTVRRGRLVDRAAQVEVTDDGGRAQVEDLVDGIGDRLGGHVLGPEGLDGDADGARNPDRVRELELAALREAGGDDVLRHPARRVGT